MTNVTLVDPVNGTTTDANQIANNNASIRAAVNGGLESANLKSTAGILAGQLAPGTNGQFLTTSGGVAVWATSPSLTVSRGTAFPGSPNDGDLFELVDSTTNATFAWLFRYSTASSFTDKWECIGGTPGLTEVTTSEGTASGTYAALATAGPSFTLPRAGVYDVEIGATLSLVGAAGGTVGFMSYDIGGTGAVDADSIQMQQPSGAFRASFARARRKTGLTAVTLTAKYKTSATNITAQDRWMRVTPVRLS